MTDEQLDELEAWVAEHCIGRSYDLITVIIKYRRLRELERACRGFFTFDDEGNAYPPSYAFGPSASEKAAQAAIGRLLEGEDAR